MIRKTTLPIILVLMVASAVAIIGYSCSSKQTFSNVNSIIRIVPPITDQNILPTTQVFASYISNQISITASPGEFEPASFVVQANQNISSLQVQASNLTGTSGSIPSSNVDIRVVKVWYQSGVTVVHESKVLTPELLLKDDSLVKIENGENYLKVSGNYVWISGPDGIPGVYVAPKSADFPVQDSATLQPVDISANTNKQFWITVKVPDNAIAGDYSGTITLTTPSGTVGQIQLNLRVLPIELSESMVTPSIYYWGCLGTGNFTNGTISFIMKSPTQFKAELKNLVDHGITNPTVYQSLDEPKLREVLQLRREAGMIDDSMYYLGLKPYGYQDPSQVATTVSIAKDYGIDNVYFYGVDEAKGNALAVQKDAWEAIRRAGGKIFASGVRAGHYSDPERSPGNFGYMGDIQDLLVCHGVPYAEEAERWHSYDHEIFCYSNPQVGEEKPETYRRNFGLLLWQRDYDGMMDFSYQHRFGNVWNDFDDSTYRDHVFTYPTVNGVIDTIQWEGQREGIDDLRYLTTLLNTIETAKTQGKGTSSAEDYLSSLKDSDLASKDLETIRSEIIAHILSLQQELVP